MMNKKNRRINDVVGGLLLSVKEEYFHRNLPN
jgi:hypothetical protein